jgi:hypothetical protein
LNFPVNKIEYLVSDQPVESLVDDQSKPTEVKPSPETQKSVTQEPSKTPIDTSKPSTEPAPTEEKPMSEFEKRRLEMQKRKEEQLKLEGLSILIF